MSKVYLLALQGYEDVTVVGIYSTYMHATSAMYDFDEETQQHISIEEFELNERKDVAWG